MHNKVIRPSNSHYGNFDLNLAITNAIIVNSVLSLSSYFFTPIVFIAVSE
jgi:hypothetical protein